MGAPTSNRWNRSAKNGPSLPLLTIEGTAPEAEIAHLSIGSEHVFGHPLLDDP